MYRCLRVFHVAILCIVDMGVSSFLGVHGVHGGLDRRTCGWEVGLLRELVKRQVRLASRYGLQAGTPCKSALWPYCQCGCAVSMWPMHAHVKTAVHSAGEHDTTRTLHLGCLSWAGVATLGVDVNAWYTVTHTEAQACQVGCE